MRTFIAQHAVDRLAEFTGVVGATCRKQLEKVASDDVYSWEQSVTADGEASWACRLTYIGGKFVAIRVIDKEHRGYGYAIVTVIPIDEYEEAAKKRHGWSNPKLGHSINADKIAALSSRLKKKRARKQANSH